MPSEDKKKAYIPWHDRVDEKLIRELAAQFVQVVYKHGIRLTSLDVVWTKGTGEFEVSTSGEPLVRVRPPDGEPPH